MRVSGCCNDDKIVVHKNSIFSELVSERCFCLKGVLKFLSVQRNVYVRSIEIKSPSKKKCVVYYPLSVSCRNSLADI